MAQQLPELTELSQQEVFTNKMGHPVDAYCPSMIVDIPNVSKREAFYRGDVSPSTLNIK